jgi:hypothetical protein
LFKLGINNKTRPSPATALTYTVIAIKIICIVVLATGAGKTMQIIDTDKHDKSKYVDAITGG